MAGSKTEFPEQETARQTLVDAMYELAEAGFNLQAEGNVSLRWKEGCLITPSAIAAKDLKAEEIVFLNAKGGVIGQGVPSSEWPLHTRIFNARPEVMAVVHTHAVFCSVLACQRRMIPAFHYMVAAFGGKTIRCAEYAPFASHELATHAVSALQDRQACLLANHGAISLGHSLHQALSRMAALEKLAHQYWLSLAHGGPVLLGQAEMETVLARFRHYGRPKKPHSQEKAVLDIETE